MFRDNVSVSAARVKFLGLLDPRRWERYVDPKHRQLTMYEGCTENICPFWISREPVAWPWSNLATSQRRPYCATVNSHSYDVGLVSRQWDTVDWACVLFNLAFTMTERADQLHHDNAPTTFYSSRAGFFGKTSHHSSLSAPLKPRFGSLRLLAFPKAKIAVEREEICECDGHTVHKLSQRRLTANWLAPRESDCCRMHSKVTSDWLTSYIKATRTVLEKLKMAGYFPYSPRTLCNRPEDRRSHLDCGGSLKWCTRRGISLP